MSASSAGDDEPISILFEESSESEDDSVSFSVQTCGDRMPPRPSIKTSRRPQIKTLVAGHDTGIDTVKFDEIPLRLRTFMNPRLFAPVNSITRTGENRFEIQYWDGSQYIDVGTISDYRIGMVLLTAMALDPTLCVSAIQVRLWLRAMMDAPVSQVNKWIWSVDDDAISYLE